MFLSKSAKNGKRGSERKKQHTGEKERKKEKVKKERKKERKMPNKKQEKVFLSQNWFADKDQPDFSTINESFEDSEGEGGKVGSGWRRGVSIKLHSH